MKKLIGFLLVFILSAQAFANDGWVVRGRCNARGNVTYLQRYFIDGNKVKFEQYNFIYSCDLSSGKLILIDIDSMLCAVTTINEYEEKNTKIYEDFLLNSFLKFWDSFADNDIDTANASVIIDNKFSPISEDSITITRINDGMKLLGHNVSEYEVRVNNKRVERFFHTYEVACFNSVDLNALNNLENLIHPTDYSFHYTATQKYTDFKKNGLIIRRFLYVDDFVEEYQVNWYENTDIPAFHYEVPWQCKVISLDKWFELFHPTNRKYDDYE